MLKTILDSAEPGMVDTAAGASITLQFGINTMAVTVAIFAVIMASRLIHKLGGRINQAIRYFILGILCNAVAISWSLFFGHLYVLGGALFDVHQNFMSLGMVFFIISTLKFSRLIQNV